MITAWLQTLTDSMRTHGLIPETILVNFDLARQPLPVRRRSDEDFRQLMRPPPLELNQRILLDNVCHLLLLLLAFVHFLLELGDLLVDRVKPMSVR